MPLHSGSIFCALHVAADQVAHVLADVLASAMFPPHIGGNEVAESATEADRQGGVLDMNCSCVAYSIYSNLNTADKQ